MILTTLQDACLKRMLEVRTSERREFRNRMAAIREYRTKAIALGYSPEQVIVQVRDLWDMFRLQQEATGGAS